MTTEITICLKRPDLPTQGAAWGYLYGNSNDQGLVTTMDYDYESFALASFIPHIAPILGVSSSMNSNRLSSASVNFFFLKS
jgi:hypothetical protein